MNESTQLWRKMPRNIVTDPVFEYISSKLPTQYQAAPYMFYTTALSLADDDGIFDLEDGIIFSRLMHMGDEKLVFTVANLMLNRRIITRAGNTTKCMFVNWEYSIKDKTPRTLDQRRQVAQRQMSEEKNMQVSNFDPNAPECTPDEIVVDFSTTPSPDQDFLCTENDKIKNNVVNPLYDDKNIKNVVKNPDTEKRREDIEREDKTHTEKKELELDKEGAPLRMDAGILRDAPEKEINTEAVDYTEWDGTETKDSNDTDMLAQEALTIGKTQIIGEDKTRLIQCFTNFFTKNCLGFDEISSRNAIMELVNRVSKLGDEKNPAEIVAATLLSQAKKLSEEDPYYKNIPLTPEELIKPGMYKHALAGASRILLTNKAVNPEWIRQMENEKAEIQAEKNVIGDCFNNEYVKYNIDPNAINKTELLLAAKAKEQEETKTDPGNKPP